VPSIYDPPRVPFASGPAGLCHGDSGGPAIAYDGVTGTPYVVGVNSHFAASPYNCTTRGVEARVGAHLMWIHQHAQGLPCDSGLPCDQRCGDLYCDGTYESWQTCGDCPPPPPPVTCGDSTCSWGVEDPCNCPQDCYCPPNQACLCSAIE
jgi:hypothetical protein